ncbi:unnamed protein product [Phytophthora fragariaefolia]|uniref:Unnamed protein product n=1 Tax=Phytophthora fragariaefolia TaxID=1490495 RepID=A0A9W6XFN6_9STRA|nr:unnamed protein product [Phytophthora fragariaefolia]
MHGKVEEVKDDLEQQRLGNEPHIVGQEPFPIHTTAGFSSGLLCKPEGDALRGHHEPQDAAVDCFALVVRKVHALFSVDLLLLGRDPLEPLDHRQNAQQTHYVDRHERHGRIVIAAHAHVASYCHAADERVDERVVFTASSHELESIAIYEAGERWRLHRNSSDCVLRNRNGLMRSTVTKTTGAQSLERVSWVMGTPRRLVTKLNLVMRVTSQLELATLQDVVAYRESLTTHARCSSGELE